MPAPQQNGPKLQSNLASKYTTLQQIQLHTRARFFLILIHPSIPRNRPIGPQHQSAHHAPPETRLPSPTPQPTANSKPTASNP
ncbi:hypothetical protein BDU57DRAFT_510118 [Ampelomyces quisqualis]|uniref:Uncharacterized protein n=1 Tax=Ampelomyces quisqualis TaxID=50730 RepID=A0A6A5R2I1_AMPQU|nr:hypothetical protein BDU57DRAFT_510118 [Ampelomyces quisqualis]